MPKGKVNNLKPKWFYINEGKGFVFIVLLLAVILLCKAGILRNYIYIYISYCFNIYEL